MTLFSIPQAALDAQTTATDPTTNVWVSANAGSGKTHVLSERVIRLLLNGTPPARILCLTYTKAAAAVMQSRIFRTLSNWSELNDSQLQDTLSRFENKPVNMQKLAHARRLFAYALETPGGLKIQTIHAFCESLLHQFSLEANIVGHFDLLDDVNQKKLLQQARYQLLTCHDAQPILKQLFKTISENTFNQLLREATLKQNEFSDFLSLILSQNGEKQLRKIFNLESDETKQSLLEKIQQTALLSPFAMTHCQTYNSPKAQNIIAQFKQLEIASDETNIINLVSGIYLNITGKPRNFSHIFSKSSDEIWPFVKKEIEEKQSLLSVLLDKYQCTKLIALNMAAFQLCSIYLKIYTNLKKENSLLDFDDLIKHTLHLLQRKGANQWVHYKLDRGIDHILLDEAQDTNPEQWKIIQLLAQEFFTGDNQRTNIRTIFAVGDEKQSIYSFQGAAPENFSENGRMIQRKVQQVHKKFEKIQLNYSFRSTADILKSVDLVFEQPENYRGLSADNAKTVHEPIRIHSPGEVIIWDAISPKTDTLPDDWSLAVDHLDTPEICLAEQIATTISDWLRKGEMLPAKGRLLKASDIMVLVRKRDQFVPALSRALKLRNIPVAGTDRLQLTSHISVRDLIALARFVLHPKDDLSLACILKSPLFAFNEEMLYQLAVQRTGSLWQSLGAHAKNSELFNAAFKNLEKYRTLVDQMPVFEFYSHVLNNDKGRQKILSRLGSEANEVLDAFMNYTLTIQKTGLPGLQAFLETLSVDKPEIKRELDQNHEEVRIMTVHAAKGLESAVVFLVDSGNAIWNAHYTPHLLKLPLNDRHAFIWRPNSEFKMKPIETALLHLKERAEEEYKRLLYVGMTRAEDRLIVCGYSQKRKIPDTWLHLVKKALESNSIPIEGPTEDISAWRYSTTPVATPLTIQEESHHANQTFPPLPSFFHDGIPTESALPKLLSLSVTDFSSKIETKFLSNQQHPNFSPISKKENTNEISHIEYGNIVHRLLQYLPNCHPQERRKYAQRYLKAKASHWSEKQKENALNDIWKILENTHLKLLFSDSSRAEVSLMGMVKIHGKQQMIHGQIDRLYVNQENIIFADFKTGTLPKDETDIPLAYLRQMALYQQLLQNIYPDKNIQAFLIYSKQAKIFLLSFEKLNTLIV
ncbi:double-strand break repair helicase AddA [Bartonella ancashensis]|uniref:DNA 3'-5' helicase n=1 Tax=Bartonella ancashensis TaxID=1318743 RepID=A0A0M4M5G2_9HYPH|nr:double-strand break repair helicase AddA [Bartonella ancashensis]ALE03292.1 ATP-dependent nuclease subunit A [Bartonella ancashensis]